MRELLFPLMEKGGIPVQEHVARAVKLIDETGYKWRLPKLRHCRKESARNHSVNAD